MSECSVWLIENTLPLLAGARIAADAPFLCVQASPGQTWRLVTFDGFCRLAGVT